MMISATLQDGQAKIAPEEFLGPAQFKQYRDACRLGGATYHAPSNSNLIALENLWGLAKIMVNHGLVLRWSEGIAQAATQRVIDLGAVRLEAQERLSAPAMSRLFPYQVEGALWLSTRASAILGDEMGLGKTPQSALAAPAGSPLVIVCPASLKGMWLTALQLWRPDLQARIVERFCWPIPGEAIIVNYERLPMIAEEIGEHHVLKDSEVTLDCLTKINPTPANITLIADEIHYAKSSKAKRTKRFRALGRAIRKAGGRTWGLSGTPMPNQPMDLLNVLQACDLLKDSFGSYPNFIRLMSGKQDYWGKWTWGPPKPGAAEALQRVMLRRRRVDVMAQLPDAIYEDVKIPLSELPAAARKADAAAREAMEAAGVSVEDLLAGRAGAAVQESAFRARRLLAEGLIPHAIEIVKDYQEQEEPLIVFSAHAAPIEAIGKLAGVSQIDADVLPDNRSKIAQAFQDGAGWTLAATIKTGGVGLTLTRAAHVLLIDEDWSPDGNDQAVARVLRIGQTRGVMVKRFVIPGTVYDDVRIINDQKRVNIAGSVDRAAVKEVKDDVIENLRRLYAR